jgi:hypothetical protein
MQSEMEKLLGGSGGPKSGPQKQDCQAVLSHYQFQVKRLRSDLQVPCQNLIVNVLMR